MSKYEIISEIDILTKQVDVDGILLPTFESNLDKLVITRDEKLRNIGALVKNIDSEIDDIKQEAQKLTNKIKVLENKKERVAKWSLELMVKEGVKQIEINILNLL